MIPALSETNRYALPTNPTTGQGTSFDANASEGYQGSAEGLSAGQRVQTGARAEPGAEHLPDRTRHPETASRPSARPDGAPRSERRSLPPFAVEANQHPRRGESTEGTASYAGSSAETPEGDDRTGLVEAHDGSVDSPAEQRELQRLRHRDAEVRAHEQAHAAAGGSYAGRPTYEFEQGPDGRRYAVAGEVQIDVAPVPDDPQATIEKMRTVRRAALAPAEPSPQDRRVAAEASRNEADARRTLSADQREERLTELAEMNGGSGPLGAAEEADEATRLRAQDVGVHSDAPLANDFTAADVGQSKDGLATRDARADEEAVPGSQAMHEVSRARGVTAFDREPRG